MSNQYNYFQNQKLSHISNYSGVFDSSAVYEKFDFVYNTGDGLFYYAKEDDVKGGGAQITAADRFSLFPSGRRDLSIDGSYTNHIIDEYNQLNTLGAAFKEGQIIEIEGSQENSDGEYKIIEITHDYDVRIKSDLDLDEVLDAEEALIGGNIPYFKNSWFFNNNTVGDDSITKNGFYWYGRDFSEWVDLFDPIYSQWESYVSSQGSSHPTFPKNLDKEVFGRFYYYSNPAGIDDFPIPIRDLSVRHDSLGSVQFSTLAGSSKEIYFYLPYGNTRNPDPVWFYTNENLTSQGLAYMVSEGSGEFGQSGWTFWQKYPGSSTSWRQVERESIGVYNFTEQKWYKIYDTFERSRRPRSVYVTDLNTAPNVSLPTTPSVPQPNEQEDYRAKILVQGVDKHTEIKAFEPASSNQLSLSIVDSFPSDSPNVWSSDVFFFDADYGSTVSYKTENHTIEYGNGYTFRSPKSINALKFEANLNFKNRTNKESNAIIHFVENHLGQLEKDAPSDYLRYSQGISGFRWDGNATFHPYDSFNSQTVRFICDGVNHEMNFENSNDISLTLKNFNTSILNKSEGLFIKRAEQFDEQEYYEYDDVVFSTGNHKYYYNISDSPVVNLSPVEEYYEDEILRFRDINKDVWSREFYWRPSIGLNVDQKFRLSEISSTNNYTQHYRDGINESLLELDLSFNSRDDGEAYAILHFLEDHLGFIPFLYSPPAPYDRKLNFVCESWSHTYVYKNTHNISAKFKQIPFNYTSEKMDNRYNAISREQKEISFTSPVVFSISEDQIDQERNFRSRVYFENIGVFDVDIYSIVISNDTILDFSILGQQANEIPLIVPDGLVDDDYIFQLPSTPTLPFSLNNKFIRLESYTPGEEGGISFRTMIDNGNGTFSEEQVNGNPNTFFQRNDGMISSSRQGTSEYSDYFVDQLFYEQKSVTQLKVGEKGYIDMIYNSAQSIIYIVDSNGNNIIDSNGDTLIGKNASAFYSNTFDVTTNGDIEILQGVINIIM